MAQHRAERLDIGRKPRFTPLTRPAVHSGPRSEKDRLKYYILRSLDTQIHDVEFCDSVRLGLPSLVDSAEHTGEDRIYVLEVVGRMEKAVDTLRIDQPGNLRVSL